MSFTKAQQSKLQEERRARMGACLVAGFGIGGALLAWGRLMHPALGALLWFSAFGLVLYGLPWLTHRRSGFVYQLIVGILFIAAISLWHETTRHAELKIISAAVLKPGEINNTAVGPINIGISVTLRNDGDWRAKLRPAMGLDLISGDVTGVPRREVEESLYDKVERLREITEPYEIAAGEQATFPFQITVTPEQRLSFDKGGHALLAVIQFRYHDWSPKEEVVELCRMFSFTGTVINCARHNGSRQTWWLVR